MKIALFTNAYLPYLSGITISVSMLKQELEALGHTVFVVGPKYPGHQESDPSILRLPSLPATYPGYRLVFPYSYKIFNKLKAEKIDLIHVHQPFGVGMSARLLSKKMGIPLVYSFHTLFSRYVHHAPFVPQRLAKRVIANYLTFFCNLADTIIVPSTMVRRLLVLRKVKVPIKVIPTGLKLEEIAAQGGRQKTNSELRRELGLPLDAKVLLFSGRLSEEKNVPFLLSAFSKILQQEKDVCLVLVGGGPKEKEYRKIGKDNHIIFTGQIPHQKVLDYCFAADIFVYASTTETQGLVVTEAKACGLPVVAVFGGGISDSINNGVDGYLVPNNQEKFVEHVVRLLKDDALREKMGKKASEDAHERFSSKTVAKNIESVYNSLINPST
ncbi:MAG: glycosyltransferase [Candidatus Saganbacteria bacterium]|nr:glycosyltransferase [Candidatus Saganbacteria bacterium]